MIDPAKLWLVDGKPVSNEAYHQDLTADSSSSLKLFRESIPLYAALRVHKTIKPEKETPSTLFGSMCHTFILEPDEFPKRYRQGPTFSRATKAWKEQAAIAESKGMALYLPPDRDENKAGDLARLEGIREGILANPEGRRLIERQRGDQVEIAWRWDCTETGLPLKTKLDCLLSSGIIIDLKTMSGVPTPDAWARAVADYGYHFQCAFYTHGMTAHFGDYCPMAFVVVDSGSADEQPGTPHECAVYSFSERDIQTARERNFKTLRELARCRETDDWSGRHSREIMETVLSPWAFK
jgi:hypothetical protein